jgi:hypothetical protein
MLRKGISIMFLLWVLVLGAETIQIGGGALINQSLPIEAFRSYSYSQQIYLRDQINTAGNISSIAFQYSITGYQNFLLNNVQWKVWLGTTDRDSLAGWIPLDSLSLVYDGTLTADDFSGGLPGQGWLNLNLFTDYFYGGNGNLVVAVDENTYLGSSSADDFFCSQTEHIRGIVFTHTSDNPDPASPPDTSASGFYARNSYPNLKLEITVFSYLPYNPVPADQADGIPIDTGLQWSCDSDTYDLWLGSSPQSLQLAAENLTQTLWHPPDPLQMRETYYWQVVAHTSYQDYPGPLWSFTTAGEGIGPPQNLNAYYITDHVALSWQAPLAGTPTLYRIWRNGVFYDTTVDLSFQDFGVSPGQAYYYYVLAENAMGEVSGPSNTVTVHIPDIIPNLILYQGFEDCPPFCQNIPGWLDLDLDGSPTWQWTGYEFPGEGSPLGWLVFFPSQVSPPLTEANAHAGAGELVSVSSLDPPNADWLISPRVNLGNTPQVTFWARSLSSDYGLERLRLLISTTDTEISSFSSVSTGNWLSVPEEWTQYTYDLSPWQGQSVYLAWNCVSWDALALLLDDISITGEGGYVANSDDLASPLDLRVYPNPSQGSFSLANPGKGRFNLSIYDLRGRKLFSRKDIDSFQSATYGLDLPSGIYLLRVESGTFRRILRLAVVK